jgi:formylglycine-generating enzyme required for sulfatase activity
MAMTPLLRRLSPILALAAPLTAPACRGPADAPAPAAAPPAAPDPAPEPARPDPPAAPPEASRGPSCPEGMALIPSGAYRMQKRRRPSRVAAFCIDVTEVTVAAYKQCVREGKCSPECLTPGQCSAAPAHADWGDAQESADVSRFCNGGRDDRPDHPVNCVTWEESRGFCEARGKRLPTPVEWEWAARRADPKTWYPWGNALPADQLCWSPKQRRSRHDGTCAAASHPDDRTPQGVFDLAGNVSEWVDTPAIPGSPRVHTIFGASWYAMDDGYVSGTLGGAETPAARSETVGFRCARDPITPAR